MKNYFVFILLLYFSGVFSFFKSENLITFTHYSVLAICICSCLYYFIRHPKSKLLGYLLLFSLAFPIYASIKSKIIFDQPFFLGIASLRYNLLILFGYFLVLIKYDYSKLIQQINVINIAIASASIIGFFFLGINQITIQPYLTTTNIIDIHVSEDLIKGNKLGICSQLMFFSYIYYLIKFMSFPSKSKYGIPFILLMIYLIFVNKGRQPLALICLCYFIYYIKIHGFNAKKIILAILPILILTALINIDSTAFESFNQIFKLTNSEDSSTLARLNDIEQLWPYINSNLILGIGNLSAHFRDYGFQTFFGPQFYLADLGFIGTLAKGGIILLIIYILIYHYMYLKIKYITDNNAKQYMLYILMSIIISLYILSSDLMYNESCICIALAFYPLYSNYNNKYNITLS